MRPYHAGWTVRGGKSERAARPQQLHHGPRPATHSALHPHRRPSQVSLTHCRHKVFVVSECYSQAHVELCGRNLVSNLLQVGFLAVCDALRDLTLAECPVCHLPGYRAAVISTLPKLTSLDGFLLAEGGMSNIYYVVRL